MIRGRLLKKLFFLFILSEFCDCTGTSRNKRAVFREQVTPELGGKIPDSAFLPERLYTNRLNKNGIYTNDGVYFQERYPDRDHSYKLYPPSTLKLEIERDNRHVSKPGRYSNSEIIDTTYLVREPVRQKLIPQNLQTKDLPFFPIHFFSIKNDLEHHRTVDKTSEETAVILENNRSIDLLKMKEYNWISQTTRFITSLNGLSICSFWFRRESLPHVSRSYRHSVFVFGEANSVLCVAMNKLLIILSAALVACVSGLTINAGYYDYNDFNNHAVPQQKTKKEREQKQDFSKIPGTPGVDYPIYHSVPHTGFSCKNVPALPGMYANVETGCQAYHVCNDGRDGDQGSSFLCANGTVFNQKEFACDWWYNVNCHEATNLYRLNLEPGKNPYYPTPKPDDQKKLLIIAKDY
ncbi:uncharacterized protein LOC132695779 [Cylas formicarius]|uniref:uncharacterized protein LOC132695779 n=1 Tax=Cylas formicarius TaxID=197179 RepID=UPI0029586F46|nr:uncharacterized protein LOC132695779 [Cylas formicarius]